MHSKLALAVTAGALLLFAACSPAATTPSGTAPAATTAAATTSASTTSAAASAAAGACAQGANTAPGAPAVEIAGFAFGPPDLTVAVGSSVTWTNKDSTAHTATADDGSFDCGIISAGQSFTFTFSTAGTFAYHCKIHSNMVGKITVT